MDQIKEYRPAPNPAKLSDSRSSKYVEQHGSSSWELDALDPDVLVELIQSSIQRYQREDLWEESCACEDAHKNRLKEMILSLP